MFSWFRPANQPYIRASGPAVILYDAGSGALLAAGSNAAIFSFLTSAIPDSDTNYISPSFYHRAILNWTPLERYPLWSWSKKKRTLIPLRREAQTDTTRARARLAQAKAAIISEIILNINLARSSLRNDFLFQDRIYLSKKMEARRFKDLNHTEEHALEYPFLLQYADLKNISLLQASDEILFKAKVDDEALAKTETLRLVYFERLRRATTHAELDPLLQEFLTDCYRNARV